MNTIVILPSLETLQTLISTPTHMFITPDGKAMYVATPSGEILQFTGVDFRTLTEDQINQYLVDQIENFMK